MLTYIKDKCRFYLSLPLPIQFGVSLQYSIYISMMLYYIYLSLPNPLFDSHNKVFHGSYVHPLSWAFVMVFALYARYTIPTFTNVENVMRFEGSKYMEYWQYIYNLLFSFLIVCFAMAITEMSWDISITYYWYANNMMNGITLQNFVLTYAFFLTGMGIIAGLMARAQYRFRYFWIIPLTFGVYHILWLASGFHISTLPKYQFDIPTQLWELGHWLLVPSLFGVLLKGEKK